MSNQQRQMLSLYVISILAYKLPLDITFERLVRFNNETKKCMMKLRIALASRLPLYFLIIGLVSLHACKNKKKLAEVSNQEAVQEQIKEEMAPHVIETPVEVEPVQEPRSESSEVSSSSQIKESMTEIGKASSFGLANQSIEETLLQFSSPDVPVLVIIYENGSEVEYDEPTTIEKYLNYLKDTKNKPGSVAEIVRDEAGKIKELVLRKN
jgi:hypothetical protein